MNPPLPLTRAECVLYRVSPCTLLEGVVVVLNDTWHNSSNKQQNQQQTERKGQRTWGQRTFTDTWAMIVITMLLIMPALHVVVVIVAFIVWFIVYTLWSVSYFLIAEISWSRDLLRLDWLQLLVVVACFFCTWWICMEIACWAELSWCWRCLRFVVGIYGFCGY